MVTELKLYVQIESLMWPSQGHYQNPIEHVWDDNGFS